MRNVLPLALAGAGDLLGAVLLAAFLGLAAFTGFFAAVFLGAVFFGAVFFTAAFIGFLAVLTAAFFIGLLLTGFADLSLLSFMEERFDFAMMNSLVFG
jgi:hypothetical protein